MKDNIKETKVLKETQEGKIVNLLTSNFINDIYNSLTLKKTIGRLNFDVKDLADLLVTIWNINMLSYDETMIDTLILREGYQIPKIFEGLLFPEITLTGSKQEERLVIFEIDEDVKGQILNKRQMGDISSAIYNSQKTTVVMVDITSTQKIVPIADYVNSLTIGDDYVTSKFEIGKYPIAPIYSGFFKKKHAYMEFHHAIEEYIISIATI